MNSGWLAWECIVFGVFIAATTFVPLWNRRKDIKAGSDVKRAYIFAGGGVSVLAMILSVARGTLGVRSFLGFPSELVYRGSAMWETLYGVILAFPLVCFIFVPVYYRLHTNSVYEYLQLRFGSRWVRRVAAATFLLRQVLNLAVTVYTPTVALHAVLGLPHWASAAVITVVGIVFNLLGGLAAAISSATRSKFFSFSVNSAINPLSSRNSSGGVAGYFGTLQSTPKRRDKRRARKSEVGTSVGGSQWYTSTSTPNGHSQPSGIASSHASSTSLDATSPLKELRQELVTERPLRADVERERRLSQRTSLLNSSAPPSNRDSMGTTDSNQDEEEPPPLPEKLSHRSMDLDGDNNNNAEPLPPRQNYDTVWTPRGSFLYTSLALRRNTGVDKPPTPPPKKKNAQNNNTTNNNDI
ncbi:hypothetical protein ACJJTC_003632 [Scirpophaga incertulas]